MSHCLSRGRRKRGVRAPAAQKTHGKGISGFFHGKYQTLVSMRQREYGKTINDLHTFNGWQEAGNISIFVFGRAMTDPGVMG